MRSQASANGQSELPCGILGSGVSQRNELLALPCVSIDSHWLLPAPVFPTAMAPQLEL